LDPIPETSAARRGENRMSEDTYRQGLDVKRRLFGAGKERPVAHGSLADDLLRLSDEVVFGRVYTRPGLDLKTRSMLTVAALTVLGRDDYLRRHLQGALHVGVAPVEIKEILMQMAFYGGMPVALKALRIAQEEIAAWESAKGTTGLGT
jgi:4-carboxymuconolactone decarboxylase